MPSSDRSSLDQEANDSQISPSTENPVAQQVFSEEGIVEVVMDPNELKLDGWGGTPAQRAEEEAHLERDRIEKAKDDLESSVPYMVSIIGGEKQGSVAATRRQVKTALPYFYHLRAHLRSSLNIQNRYSSEIMEAAHFLPRHYPLGSTPDIEEVEFNFSNVAKDQIVIVHRYCAVSETLQSLHNRFPAHLHVFGLLYNSSFRENRNYFSHDSLTPGGGEFWSGCARQAKESHELLLRQVDGTIHLLKKHLDEKSVWYERPVTPDMDDAPEPVSGDVTESVEEEAIKDESEHDDEELGVNIRYWSENDLTRFAGTWNPADATYW